MRSAEAIFCAAMNLDTPTLENEYVRLVVMEEAHRPFFRDSTAAEAMWEWVPILSMGTNLDSYLDAALALKEAGRFIPFVVFSQRTGAFCGMAAFSSMSRTHRRARIDFTWISEEYRGTVIGPATNLALLQRAVDCRIRRLELIAPTEMPASLTAIERLGAKREGVLRAYCRVASGEWADMALYSLVGKEIHAAMAILKDRIFQSSTA